VTGAPSRAPHRQSEPRAALLWSCTRSPWSRTSRPAARQSPTDGSERERRRRSRAAAQGRRRTSPVRTHLAVTWDDVVAHDRPGFSRRLPPQPRHTKTSHQGRHNSSRPATPIRRRTHERCTNALSDASHQRSRPASSAADGRTPDPPTTRPPPRGPCALPLGPEHAEHEIDELLPVPKAQELEAVAWERSQGRATGSIRSVRTRRVAAVRRQEVRESAVESLDEPESLGEKATPDSDRFDDEAGRRACPTDRLPMWRCLRNRRELVSSTSRPEGANGR
jgi:hypothetical protein